MKKRGKQSRIFSEEFKREKVKLLDEGKIKVAEISKIYDVSKVSVYHWLKKFSSVPKDERMVVEKISEAKKTIELYNQVKNLEQALGRKQMKLDYYRKVVELASEEKGEDLEKKYKPKQ